MALVMLVAMGAERCSLSALGRKGGTAEVSEIGIATGKMGELPLFPLLIKREGHTLLGKGL